MEMGVEMRMGKRKREDEVEREGESGRVPFYPRGGRAGECAVGCR